MAQKESQVIASAQTLTASYVVGNSKASFAIDGESIAELFFSYTTGAAETSNTLDIKLEFSYDGTNWFQQTIDTISAGVNTLTDLALAIAGASAATTYTKSYRVPLAGKYMRVSFKETGEAANFGAVSCNVVIGPEGQSYNHQSIAVSMSLDEFPAAALLADATANPTTTNAASMNEVFNGTTWDLQRGGLTTNSATATGFANVIPEARYNAAPVARTEGQFGPLQESPNGGMMTQDEALRADEDLTNNVSQSVLKPLSVATYTPTRDSSTALEASSISKASAGNLIGYEGNIDKSAATGIYYVLFLDSATLTGDGAVTHLISPEVIVHTTGTDSHFVSKPFKYDIAAANGITSCLSTTMVTKTIAGAYLFYTVEVK